MTAIVVPWARPFILQAATFTKRDLSHSEFVFFREQHDALRRARFVLGTFLFLFISGDWHARCENNNNPEHSRCAVENTAAPRLLPAIRSGGVRESQISRVKILPYENLYFK